jgi:outer membrane protein assembly factor BamB
MPHVVYIGLKGSIIALDRGTGAVLWSTKLKGGAFVTVHLDRDRVFGATAGELFCVDASTGALLWRNELPGMGLGLVSIATASGSSSCPQVEKKKQDDDAAAVSSASF